ncbi:MAG: hypothetical protein QM765_08510 [Myxococcales bacterium]
MKSRLLVALLALSFAVACTEKSGGGAAAPGKAADPAKPAEPAKPATKTVKIDALSLSFELPADTEIGEAMEVMGSYTFPCCGGAAIQVNPVKADSLVQAQNFDDAKKSVNDFQNPKLVKADKTADGWRIEYDHDSGMGRTFKVLTRRTFGAQGYDCEATANDAEKAKLASKGCETLKGPAGAAAPAKPADEAAKADAPKADAPAAAAEPAVAAAGASCEKAAKCCEVLSGKSPACDNLLKAPEETCKTSLVSFKKAVKASKPKQLKLCD